MTIVIAKTEAAELAAQAFAERTGTCIQEALNEADIIAYCHCEGCLEEGNAQAQAEAWAEGAWLRAAENVEYNCYCGAGQPGICC